MAWLLSAFADEAGAACEEQIAALQRAGIPRIDLRGVDGINISELPLDHAKRVREQLDRAGIAVGMLGSPVGKIDIADAMTIDLDKIKHLARLAPVLNCTAVRIFSYYNRKAPVEKQAFQEASLRRLTQLKTLAKELGLTLYHENESHIFGDRVDDVLLIGRELRDPGARFKMIFDFGNFTAGRENAWDAWVKLRDMTDAIHIKDNHWTERDGIEELQHTPAGQGGGFVKEIIADAVKRRFAGPVSVESHLVHSTAVAATGPSGISNQAYQNMSLQESFQIACAAAKDVLIAAGAVIG